MSDYKESLNPMVTVRGCTYFTCFNSPRYFSLDMLAVLQQLLIMSNPISSYSGIIKGLGTPGLTRT